MKHSSPVIVSALAVALVAFIVTAQANAETACANAVVPSGGGGSNWATAYNDLQDALTDAATNGFDENSHHVVIGSGTDATAVCSTVLPSSLVMPTQ